MSLSDAADSTPETAPWWGRFEIETDECLDRQIESLRIRTLRLEREWHITTERGEVATDGADPPVPNRYVFTQTRGPLHLLPTLAERLVITRPLAPLRIASGAMVTLYISTPVAIEISVGEPPVVLEEVFVIRPSDTWFGPSTYEGELCYASRTSARLTLADLPVRPDRALTTVNINNQGSDALLLERIAVPTRHLNLFAAPTGGLWTQDVSFTRKGADELADLALADGPPRDNHDAKMVCEAREAAGENTLFRAFGAMFG